MRKERQKTKDQITVNFKFDKPTLHPEWARLFGTKPPRIKHTSIDMHHELTPKLLFFNTLDTCLLLFLDRNSCLLGVFLGEIRF